MFDSRDLKLKTFQSTVLIQVQVVPHDTHLGGTSQLQVRHVSASDQQCPCSPENPAITCDTAEHRQSSKCNGAISITRAVSCHYRQQPFSTLGVITTTTANRPNGNSCSSGTIIAKLKPNNQYCSHTRTSSYPRTWYSKHPRIFSPSLEKPTKMGTPRTSLSTVSWCHSRLRLRLSDHRPRAVNRLGPRPAHTDVGNLTPIVPLQTHRLGPWRHNRQGMDHATMGTYPARRSGQEEHVDLFNIGRSS